MLSLIAQGKYTSTIGYDKCQAFINWLRRQALTKDGQNTNSEQKVETPKPNVPALSSPQPSKNFKPRITFSQNEIENLTEWFNEDQRPSKEVMQQYTDILNIPRKIASIRLLTPESIYFWFKNKRSKKRREESSLLEPWERENKMSEGGDTPQVTMAIGDGPETVTTGDTPTIETMGGTPSTRENGVTSISMVTTGEESEESCMPINGLATMLVQYTPQVRQLNYGESPTMPRKIPKSRVTYDPQTELSNLNKWYDDNERPDKEIIEEYTNILNEARSQKSKRMLTPDSIAMWFKNKRAKRRRSEGNLVYLDGNDGQQVVQTIEEYKNDRQAGSTSKATDVIAGTDATTAVDVTTSLTIPTVEVTVSSVTDSTNTGAVSDQVVTDEENCERNVFSAGLVAVKTTT